MGAVGLRALHWLFYNANPDPLPSAHSRADVAISHAAGVGSASARL
jgi:hypothetical protein